MMSVAWQRLLGAVTRTAIRFLAIAVILGGIAAAAPHPISDDRGVYIDIGHQVPLPDCWNLHCGRFLIAAVLEHLNDQITALGSIARLTKETMVIVTPVLQTEERIARLEPTADNPDYDYTWWRYSVGSYREILKILGFSIARVTESKYLYDHGDRLETRSTIVAVRD